MPPGEPTTPSRSAPAGRAADPAHPEGDASLYLHPQTLARLASFELRAKMIVEGLSSGTHRSPFQGYSVEFAQHRPYVAGDDLRHLDWKVFGRSDKLQLKQYQQETSLDLIVMVDSSGSMGFGSRAFAEASGIGRELGPGGSDRWTKYDHATAVAAALSYITLRQQDRAGLAIFADDIRAMVKRSGARQTWRQIVGVLGSAPVSSDATGREADLPRAVDQILGQVQNRCLIALVSDFFFDPAQLRAALARVRHARHDVIAFQIMDRAELTFDYRESAPFEGLEGEPMLRVDPRSIREGYLAAMRAHNAAVEKSLRGFGFDYHLISTHEWLGPAIAAFVARRNARIKRSKYG